MKERCVPGRAEGGLYVSCLRQHAWPLSVSVSVSAPLSVCLPFSLSPHPALAPPSNLLPLPPLSDPASDELSPGPPTSHSPGPVSPTALSLLPITQPQVPFPPPAWVPCWGAGTTLAPKLEAPQAAPSPSFSSPINTPQCFTSWIILESASFSNLATTALI